MADAESDKTRFYLTFNEANGIADLIRDESNVDMSEINARILAKHPFPDPTKHFDFLCEAAEIIQGFSRIELRDKIVVVPSDLTEFKKVKAKFLRICDKIDELAELIFEIRSDATGDMLLQHFDGDNKLGTLKKTLPSAMRVFAQIDDYTGTAGNRPTGKWAENFCVHCQRFWAQEIGGGTRLMFESERRTQITHWVEDVYEQLRKSLGIRTPISKIKTVARSVAAYRLPDEPVIGDTSDSA